MDHDIEFHLITDPNHSTRDGFVTLYQAAFAEPPYHEHYTHGDVVHNVWLPHILGEQCVVTATRNGEVVGLGCAHHVLHPSATIGQFLTDNQLAGEKIPFPLSFTVYMSELAVSPSARKLGLGTELVRRRWQWAQEQGFTNFCMRTAEEGSNSRHLYEKLGAKRAPFVQNVISESVKSDSETRIILFGDSMK